MKANELQIGDWVSYKNHVGLVSSLTTNGVCVNFNNSFVGADDSEITPIPLTEKILKANADGGSCSFNEFRSLYHLKNNGYHQDITIEFDKSWFVPFVEITGMGRTTIKVDMQYVHELQHALRLCGLNDLADSFKVE